MFCESRAANLVKFVSMGRVAGRSRVLAVQRLNDWATDWRETAKFLVPGVDSDRWQSPCSDSNTAQSHNALAWKPQAEIHANFDQFANCWNVSAHPHESVQRVWWYADWNVEQGGRFRSVFLPKATPDGCQGLQSYCHNKRDCPNAQRDQYTAQNSLETNKTHTEKLSSRPTLW